MGDKTLQGFPDTLGKTFWYIALEAWYIYMYVINIYNIFKQIKISLRIYLLH